MNKGLHLGKLSIEGHRPHRFALRANEGPGTAMLVCHYQSETGGSERLEGGGDHGFLDEEKEH